MSANDFKRKIKIVQRAATLYVVRLGKWDLYKTHDRPNAENHLNDLKRQMSDTSFGDKLTIVDIPGSSIYAVVVGGHTLIQTHNEWWAKSVRWKHAVGFAILQRKLNIEHGEH